MTNESSTVDDTTLLYPKEPVAELTSATGMKFLVPEVFLEVYEELLQENKTLRTRGLTQGVASSTRMDEDRARQHQEHVRLQETYACQYPANSTQEGVSTPQAQVPDQSQPQLGNRTRIWGEGRGISSREIPQPLSTYGVGGFTRREIPRTFNNNVTENSSIMRRNAPIVDVGLTVRKWNVTFSGDRGQSIEAFLERVETCSGSTSLSEAEVFQALPELLRGMAAMWFQVEKYR